MPIKRPRMRLGGQSGTGITLAPMTSTTILIFTGEGLIQNFGINLTAMSGVPFSNLSVDLSVDGIVQRQLLLDNPSLDWSKFLDPFAGASLLVTRTVSNAWRIQGPRAGVNHRLGLAVQTEFKWELININASDTLTFSTVSMVLLNEAV